MDYKLWKAGLAIMGGSVLLGTGIGAGLGYLKEKTRNPQSVSVSFSGFDELGTQQAGMKAFFDARQQGASEEEAHADSRAAMLFHKMGRSR